MAASFAGSTFAVDAGAGTGAAALWAFCEGTVAPALRWAAGAAGKLEEDVCASAGPAKHSPATIAKILSLMFSPGSLIRAELWEYSPVICIVPDACMGCNSRHPPSVGQALGDVIASEHDGALAHNAAVLCPLACICFSIRSPSRGVAHRERSAFPRQFGIRGCLGGDGCPSIGL